MQKLVRDYLDELKKQRKKHRRARIAVMLLVVLVVGTVTGGLTRNGITMTEDARCGLIEHVHTDECYQEVLICGYGGLLQEEDSESSDSVQDASVSDSLREDPVSAPEKAEEREESLPEASVRQTVGHHHTDDCYELRDVLLCSEKESESHTHTDDCYEIETSLECGQEESEGHTHTDDCYETETEDVLVCDLKEDEDHEHTDDCYESESTSTLICGKEESEGHTHTEECEVSERVLVCNKEEYIGHEHTDDCYGQEEVLICGQKEGEEPVNSESPKQDLPSDAQDEKTEQHIHTEDCYELQPVCGIPEHTHSEECQIDTSADVEDASEWDAQYADMEWADAWGADLVTAAQMQVGYRESVENYRIAADGSHKGYNRYGAFAGDAYADWDAAFVNFCMYYAGLTDTDIFPQELDAGDWYDAFVEADENNIEYLTTPDDYEPEVGDLIFFEREKEAEREEEPERMMGIVSSYDEEENTVTVIEGNSDNEVRENTYDIDDEQINAYLMITALEESVKTGEPVTDGTGLIFTTEDVEDASDWDAQYADVEWTDAWGANLVTAAQMQIGYRESEDDYEVAEDGSLKGYTRYGAFAGDEYADWDAAFVNFCMYYAGLTDTGLFPQELDAGDWYDAFAEADEQNMEYLTAPEGYEPEAGDLVFFERETEEGEPKKEMGIVSSYDAEQNEITVIEGDSDDEVRENTYDADDEQISSYLMITALEESVNIRTLTAEGEDYTVEVRFTEEAGIPEDAVLDVREITADSDEYQMYCEQSLEALEAEAFSFVRCFDITFLVDGEKIEPTASVDIRITYADTVEMDEEGENSAVHFAADGAEILEVETDEEGRSFLFSQDSFSVTLFAVTTRAADMSLFEKCEITDLGQLDGRSFLIANITTANVTWVMNGSRYNDGMQAYKPDSNKGNLDDSFWTFKKADGSDDEFYIYRVGKNNTLQYLNIANAGIQVKTTTNPEETQKLKVEKLDGGKIAISFAGNYLNNGGNGSEERFLGWSGGGKDNVGSKLTLYRLKGEYQWNVVLNPLNISGSNSIYSFELKGDFQNNRIVEKIDNTISDTATIFLPNDVKRQEGFSLRKGSSEYLINNGGTQWRVYQWKLKGWYNIGTGQYYSVKDGENLEDGMLKVEVSRNQTNVFYADWIAADYANPQPDKAAADDFITTTLFDYNDLVNIMLAKEFSGKIGVQLQSTDGMSERWAAITGLSGGGASKFYFYNNSLGSSDWSLQKAGTKDSYEQKKLTDAMFTEKDNKFFKTFFSNSGAMGVQYVGQADGLFTVGSDGYYSYDSNVQAAVYNQQEQKFTLYDPQWINNGGSKAFLPLNAKSDPYKAQYQVNYWFGMKTEINFWLNDDIRLNKTGNENQQLNYNDYGPMEFQFSGDDDVWVFVDDKLVLDLSGTHGVWQGSINFSTGKVTEDGTPDGHLNNLNETFTTGEHTLTMYYMERGSNESNCKIRFNLIPTWNHEGAPAQTVTTVKEWKHADGTAYSEDEKRNLSVKVYLDEVTDQGEVEVPGSEQILNESNNWTCMWKNLDKDKKYSVREEEPADCKAEVTKSATSQDDYWIESSTLKEGDEIVIGSGVLNVDPYVLNSNNLSIGTIGVSGNKDVLIDAGTDEDIGAIKVWYAKGETRGTIHRPDSTISSDQIWRVHIDDNSTGKHLLFKLESASSSTRYLKIMNGKLELVDKSAGDVFYFSPDGTLATGSYKLVLENGSFKVVSQSETLKDKKDEDKGSVRRVHIYKRNDKSVKTAYTITNTELAVGIQITKVSRSEEKVLLPGATFNIYKDGDCDAKGNIKPGASPVNETPLVSDDEGMIATGKILKVGTYYLMETKAPEGYALLESPIIITVIKTGEGKTAEANVTKVEYQADYWDDASHAPQRIDDTDIYAITVPNIVLYMLPSTGGIGIYWYMFGGVLLMISAVLIVYKTKVKNEQRS